MFVRLMLAGVLALGLGSAAATAQTSDTPITRDPVLGTKGRHVRKPKPSAAAEAKADKQPSGTENGNQPDRAAAGGGGR